MKSENWTDAENELVVQDYMEMLILELSGRPFNKAERKRRLAQLIPRSEGAIEFKRQNVSAILRDLGLPWIKGFKPLPNVQIPLIKAVEQRLPQLDVCRPPKLTESFGGLDDPHSLYIGPPPNKSLEITTTSTALNKAVRIVDYLQLNAQKSELGEMGEAYALGYERSRLIALGRQDLADRIEWTAKERGDGAGFDILSYNEDGSPLYVEVKTTNGPFNSPFYLTPNEIAFSTSQPDAYKLLRLYDFANTPKAYELFPPLTDHVHLEATVFRASFTR